MVPFAHATLKASELEQRTNVQSRRRCQRAGTVALRDVFFIVAFFSIDVLLFSSLAQDWKNLLLYSITNLTSSVDGGFLSFAQLIMPPKSPVPFNSLSPSCSREVRVH